jgi:hypothetical protein
MESKPYYMEAPLHNPMQMQKSIPQNMSQNMPQYHSLGQQMQKSFS